MSDKTLIAKGIDLLFKERGSFFVIGLTGRTGSGCTTIATKILKKEKFKDINIDPVRVPIVDHEDRKRKILSTWLDVHWKPFEVIQVSQVITSFCLENSSEFKRKCNEISGEELFSESDVKLYELEFIDLVNSNEISLLLNDIYNVSDDKVHQLYNYFYVDLPLYSNRIKKYLNEKNKGIYTKAYQYFGDKIRLSGTLTKSEPYDTKNLFALPERIHKIINVAKRNNKLLGITHNYFAIDALRYQFEIRYFKERLPAFYAMAVTAQEDVRVKRLLDLGLRNSEIEELDEKEYPNPLGAKRSDDYLGFVSQNIQACLEISDIYISNSEQEYPENLAHLSYQVIKYVALMQHPGLVTPGAIERCMQAAVAAKMNSGCISRQVGAVITDENFSIKAVGWNDVPKGQVPCVLRYASDLTAKRGDLSAFSDYELKNVDFHSELKKNRHIKNQSEQIKGRHVTYCFKSVYNNLTNQKNQVHTRALHAEENAFLQLSKYGSSGIEGGNLFTSASPCELCAKKAYQLGIKNIFFIDPYPGISNTHILGVGVNRPNLVLFDGAIGRAYHDLYDPIIPYKDELGFLMENE